MNLTLQGLRKIQFKERADYLEMVSRQSADVEAAARQAGINRNAFTMMVKRYTGKTFTQIKEQS